MNMPTMRISTVQLQPVFGDRNMAITSHHHHIVLIYCDQYPKNGYRGYNNRQIQGNGSVIVMIIQCFNVIQCPLNSC